MQKKPDFYQISRADLRAYVLSHREDEDALRIYMDRIRTEPGITRITGTSSEEDLKKLEELLRGMLDKGNSANSENYRSKYDQRQANIGGIVDTARRDSNPEFHQYNQVPQTLLRTVQEIQQLLDRFSRSHPSTTTTDRMIVASKTIEAIENNPNWKQNAISACKQGLLEAMKTHPIGAFVVGAIEGWK